MTRVTETKARRRHTKIPAGILTCLALSWTLCLESPAAETGVGLDQMRGWKWDVTIDDQPGRVTPWMSAPRLIGDEIVIRGTSRPDNV